MLLRSVFATLGIVVIIIAVIGSAMSFVGWTGIILNATNSSVPIIIMTIAIANSVHVADRVLSGMSDGLERDTAIVESLKENAWPVFLTSMTTIIGFLSLNTSEIPPYRVLGNLVAFGMMTAFAYSMTLLPTLLSVLLLRARPARTRRHAFFEHLGVLVVTRRRMLFWPMLAVAVRWRRACPA